MANFPEPERQFTSEELADIELEIPAFRRIHKLAAEEKLRQDLQDPSKRGGVHSPLDPINQHKLLGYGKPNRHAAKEDLGEIGSDKALYSWQKKNWQKISGREHTG